MFPRGRRRLTGHGRLWALLALVSNLWTPGFLRADVVQPAPASPFSEALLEVQLNGQNLGDTALVLVRPDGRVLVRLRDLERWRLNPQNARTESYRQETYVSLDEIRSLSYRIDTPTQTLRIAVTASSLRPSVLPVLSAPVGLARVPSTGAFLNYDLLAQHAGATGSMGARLDIGAFRDGMTASTELVYGGLKPGGFIRLDSTVTMDHPDRMASWRVGDSVSRGGSWGRPVRFGGVQFSTNFATQPNFITFPLPPISGVAAVPSTSEVFVNNIRTYQRDIPAGPFTINDLPVMTGQGEVRLVVQDLLGRQQVIVQPYYVSPSLLKQGLDDFSYEFGLQRKDFGSASNRYGPWMVAGTLRHGVTDQFTAEVHGEGDPDRWAVGVGATVLLPQLGVLDGAIAASGSARGRGGLLALGFERQAPGFSYGIRTRLVSPHFDEIGIAQAPWRQTHAHAAWTSDRLGSFGLAYIQLDHRHGPSDAVLSASFNRRLGPDWSLSLSAFRNLNDSRQSAVSVTLTHVLDRERSVRARAAHSGGSSALVLQAQKNLPSGPGVGYHVLGGTDEKERFQGGLNIQTPYGLYSLEAARSHGVNGFRASASGAVATLGGSLFLARRLGDSFALVRVPGYPGVQVYSENRPVARTDETGSVFVPGLRPYQNNRLSIELRDLPLDVRIGAEHINVVPYYRSGYRIDFPVTKANGAVLRVVLADGKPVPAGALARVVGVEETFPVALDGQLYVAGLAPANRILVQWDTKACEVYVPYPPTTAPLPDLGTFQCQPVNP